MEISLAAEIARNKVKRKDIAKDMDIPYPTFCRKLANNGFLFCEAQKILEYLGYEVKICKKICA